MLAVSPKEGVLHDLYKKGCIGYYGDVNDVESIKNALLCAWEDFINRRIKENVIDNSFKPQCVAEAYRDIMNELSRE